MKLRIESVSLSHLISILHQEIQRDLLAFVSKIKKIFIRSTLTSKLILWHLHGGQFINKVGLDDGVGDPHGQTLADPKNGRANE